MKVMFPDSQIAQSMFMKRSKCTEVVKVIGKCAIDETLQKLKTNHFSVIIDETTDVSTQKSCAVLVKYFDSEACTIKTSVIDLMDLYTGDKDNEGSSGQNLYTLIKNFFTSHDIPLANFIGFAADGASNLMGKHNSVSSRLKDTLPGITILKCICHSIHLCSSEAAKTLPRHCEDLLRNIYSYFSHSAKRRSEFRMFQEFCEAKPHKILHACQTRWLSLHQAVTRVLEQWQPLSLYFESKNSEERLVSVLDITKQLKYPLVLCIYKF